MTLIERNESRRLLRRGYDTREEKTREIRRALSRIEGQGRRTPSLCERI